MAESSVQISGEIVILLWYLTSIGAGIFGYVLGRSDERLDRENDELCERVHRLTWRNHDEPT